MISRWFDGYLLVLLASLALAALPGVASGQFARPARPGNQVTNTFLPAPRSLRQQLSRARKAVEEGRFAEAVDRLGQLLAAPELGGTGSGEPVAQDYFLSPSGKTGTQTPGTQISLKSEVRHLLGSMPTEGRELYELKFGADARQLLRTAVEQGDIQQLLEVTRRYFHTKAGYDATMLLGRHYLDQGRPLAAALSFQRLATIPDGLIYDPQLSVLLATCWHLAAMPERARETLLGLKARTPQATLRVGNASTKLFENDDQAITWLTQLIGDGFSSGPMEASQWVMFRGDAARNAKSIGEFPLLHARWRVRTANHPTDEQLIRLRQEQYHDQGVPAFPSSHPLAVANVALMRTPRRLIAVDMETGKRIWEFPWFDSPDEKSLYNDRVRPRARSQAARAIELNQRVWDDAAFGQVSSDGRQVFILWELGFATSSSRQMPVIVQPGGRIRPGGGPVRYNKIAALDLNEQGKLRWIVGGEDGTDDPALAGCFFLGAPLPLMEQLFVMAEVNSELRLIALDAETGRLKWSQQLAHVDMRDITQDPLRRLAGASPSFSDGVLICPTSAGAVVAVDTATRSLLWGYQFPQSRPSARNRMSMYRTASTAIGDRWADATATIAEGRVLLTPVESEHLYCLNLLTGELSWPPRPRNGLLYTGCIHQGQAVMVGRDRVEAFSLADGKTTWTLPLPDGVPSGRGLLTGNEFLLPTTSHRLLKINVDDGTIVQDHATEQVLGNLVAYQDQILSQGVDWLAAYYQAEPLRQTVRTRLEKDPNDIWALTQQAELHLYDGKRAEAIAVLRSAHDLAPDDDSVRSLLVTSLMAALRESFADNRRFADDLERLIDRPELEAEYYRLMAVGLQGVNEYDKSLKFYVKLASLEPKPVQSGDSERANLVEVNPKLRVRNDRWIRTRLTEMFATAEGPARQQIDQTINGHLDEVVAAGSLGRLRRFVSQFGGHPSGNRARLEFAHLLIQHNNLLEAELHLVDLHDSPDTKAAGKATAMLAQLLRQVGRTPDAAHYYRELGTRFGDTVVLDELTGKELAANAEKDESILRALDPAAQWPYGKRVVEKLESQPRQFQKHLRVYPMQLSQANGPFLQNHRIAYHQSMNAILIRDRFGNTVRQVLLGDGSRFYSTNYSTSRATAKGHLLMLTVGYEVVVLDMLRSPSEQQDAILWRKDLSSSITAAPTGQRRLTTQTITRSWGPDRHVLVEKTRSPIGRIGPITRNGVLYQKGQELTCADALTGESIWVREGLEAGSDVFGDDEFLFVVGPTANEALVLNTADGTEVGRRPVPTRQDRWLTRGRRVLICETENGKLRMRLFNALDQADIWQQEFHGRSQCWLVDNDEVAVMQPSGEFVVLRIQDGEAQLEAQLKPEPDLARLFVLASKKDYLVVASDQRDNSSALSSGVQIFGPLGLDHCRLINGHIYSFDRETGKPLWPTPAKVHQFSLPLDQPTEIPLVVLLRHISSKTPGQSRSTSTTASMLCLDRRDGRQILREDGLPPLSSYSVIGTPSEKLVQITTNSVGFKVTFTDEPAPEEPPLQMKEPVSPLDTFEKVRGKIADTILGVFTKPKKAAEAGKDGADGGEKEEVGEEKEKEKEKEEEEKEGER